MNAQPVQALTTVIIMQRVQVILASFSCSCNDGYSGNGTECVDDDECKLETDNCHADARCTNTEGSLNVP
eukprot:UN01041